MEEEYIIRFSGNLQNLALEIGFTYVELLGNFAVIYISSEKISMLLNNNNILYIEPSRRIFYESIKSSYEISCMNFNSDIFGNYNNDITESSLNNNDAGNNLTGKGIITAIIDSGIDLLHPVFNNSNIIEVWDQTTEGNPPAFYPFGNTFDNPSNIDVTSHGTSVAGIISYCVPDSPLLIVKLRGNTPDSSNTAALIFALDYCIRKSIRLNMPMVINLSYGNNYGNHAGDSIIEAYIDQNSLLSKLTFVVGMGNEGDTKRHAQFMFGNTAWEKSEIIANPFLKNFSIQIWKELIDAIDFFFRTPGGDEIGPINSTAPFYSGIIDNNLITINTINPTPYNPLQEILINVNSTDQYVSEGLWTVKFRPKAIINGRVDLWLPVQAATSSNVEFLSASPFTTMTIPSTADNVISVGAYNQQNLTYANFSGRGYTRDGRVKPDLVAPGVNINLPVPGGTYQIKSGTSFATPFVSAAAAMLMQWGISDGNDPFMYGEKVNIALRQGATRLPGYKTYPNEYVGYGALCVRDSLTYIQNTN